MVKVKFSLVMFANLLKTLEEERKVVLNEFHYGSEYKSIAIAIYEAAKSTKEYSTTYQEISGSAIVTLIR